MWIIIDNELFKVLFFSGVDARNIFMEHMQKYIATMAFEGDKASLKW